MTTQMTQADHALYQIFIAEAKENIERSYEALDQVKSASNKLDYINEIARSIHTIKGSCPTFGLKEAQHFAHEFENRLQAAKSNLSIVDDAFINKARQDVELLERMLFASQDENISNKSGSKTNQQDLVRVPLNMISYSLNNIWEIFLTHNQMNYAIERVKKGEVDIRDFFRDWDILDAALRRNVNELESQVMSMRMTSMDGLFSRMRKVVDNYLTQNTDKKIYFKTVGESTEVDKKVSDRLTEPLIHLIRNALDHGIETSFMREHSGKLGHGVVTLTAKTTADRVIISVEDDGKGIDPKKIMAKALEKGVITQTSLSESEIVNLIFAPGFSTAENVTETSGRGVGMDSVRTSIEQLGGSVEIKSQVGAGSQFIISLPLSLSVISALTFQVNGHRFGANTHDIVEIVKINPDEIKRNGDHDYFYFRDSYVRVLNLKDFLKNETVPTGMSRLFIDQSRDASNEHKGSSSSESKLLPLILIDRRGEHIALMVGEIFKDSDIIVKNIPSLAPRISFVDGMSILATGEPIFIVSFSKLTDAMEALQPKEKKELYESA